MTMTQRYAGALRRYAGEFDLAGKPVQGECVRQAARHMEQTETELRREIEALQLEVEGLRLRLMSAQEGAAKAEHAELLYRQAEELITDQPYRWEPDEVRLLAQRAGIEGPVDAEGWAIVLHATRARPPSGATVAAGEGGDVATQAQPPRPAGAPALGGAPFKSQRGKAWLPSEDRRLCREFDAGTSLEDMAALHGRTPGGIAARLVRLGKIDQRADVRTPGWDAGRNRAPAAGVQGEVPTTPPSPPPQPAIQAP